MVVTTPSLVDSAVGAEVRFGPVPDRLTNPSSSGVLWQVAAQRFLLTVPDVARYLVEDGRTITVDPMRGAEPAEVQRFLRTTPLTALHLQRGTPVLHASVVARPEPGSGAIVLAGDSCAGKSVLAATLWARGYRVLADDIAPVALAHDGDRAIVLPTGGDLVLWPDAVERLFEAVTQSGRLAGARVMAHGPAGQRRRVDATNEFDSHPRRIHAIWRIAAHNDEIDVREIHGVARFASIGSMAVNSRIASALLDRRAYAAVVGALATSAVPMRRLARSRGRWCAEELADIVEAGGVT